MGVYEDLQLAATEIMTEFGKPCVLFDEPTTPLDAAKPWRGSSRNEALWTKVTVTAVEDEFEREEVDGDRVRSTDLLVIVSGGDAGLGSFDVSRVTGADMEGQRYAALC